MTDLSLYTISLTISPPASGSGVFNQLSVLCCVRLCVVKLTARWKVEFSVSSLDSRYEGYQLKLGQGRDLHSGEVAAEFMACLDDPETERKASVIKANTLLQPCSELVASP